MRGTSNLSRSSLPASMPSSKAWLMSSAFAAAISSARASSASAIAASRPFFTSVVDFARARCASAARSAIAHTASNTPPDT